MKIVVTGKNITISEKIQEAIEKKFDKFGKYFTEDVKANVVIHPERDKVKMETTIVAKGTIFRAENISQDIFDCIDFVGDKLQAQISKYKGKMVRKNKANESVRFEMIPEVEIPENEGTVVKSKKFKLEPMSVDEAVLQMEMLQHDFFVFLNVETDNVAVVYVRADGDYGVLDTTY